MNKITLFMETTKKEPEQTIAEIQLLLKPLKVRHIIMKYGDDGNVSGMSFSMLVNNQNVPFKLPCKHKPLWLLAQRGETKYIKDEDPARRVAWRQVYRWIEAQIALIRIEMVKPEEIFLPYMMVGPEKTLYESVVDGEFKQLLSGGK